MAPGLVDQQIPAVLRPPNVSIHGSVEVKVKGEIVLCSGGIDEQVVCNKMQQALVNMRKTFRTQPPVMLKLDSKRLKEHTSSISLIIILCATVLKDSCS